MIKKIQHLMNNLNEIESEKYISLKTYRKNNQPVRTPVWFIIKNDLIFFKNVGAYGASMSSTYNSRPIIPEIMVYKKHFGIVRNKENVIKQIAKEKIPNWILKIKS